VPGGTGADGPEQRKKETRTQHQEKTTVHPVREQNSEVKMHQQANPEVFLAKGQI